MNVALFVFGPQFLDPGGLVGTFRLFYQPEILFQSLEVPVVEFLAGPAGLSEDVLRLGFPGCFQPFSLQGLDRVGVAGLDGGGHVCSSFVCLLACLLACLFAGLCLRASSFSSWTRVLARPARHWRYCWYAGSRKERFSAGGLGLSMMSLALDAEFLPGRRILGGVAFQDLCYSCELQGLDGGERRSSEVVDGCFIDSPGRVVDVGQRPAEIL